MSHIGVNILEVDERFSFLRVTVETRNLLREARPLVDREIDRILDGFFAHLARFPEVAALFEDETMLRHAKQQQKLHWLNIISGDVAKLVFVTPPSSDRFTRRRGWSRVGT